MIDDAITELEPLVGTRQACRATGRPQANHYRRHRMSPPRFGRRGSARRSRGH
jgi:putative transposase